ncbi:MAG: Sec-independent protein translocase protein TatB [Chloroflexota bacterium]|nr:Sec-independent protein translocase protein TatB [Chloroflexota bacterium]
MDFIGIGFPEIVLILVIALLLVGPRRLPEVARTMGKAMRKFKLATTELTRSLTEEIDSETRDIKKDIREAAEEVAFDAKQLQKGIEKNLDLGPEVKQEQVAEKDKSET